MKGGRQHEVGKIAQYPNLIRDLSNQRQFDEKQRCSGSHHLCRARPNALKDRVFEIADYEAVFLIGRSTVRVVP
jgi:hypothetical protein